MSSYTYSFLSIVAAISDPNGTFSIGSGAGASDEGITITMADDKASLVVGADGQGMHSLHAAKNGTVTVRLLKTSPTNALLQDLYSATTSSPADYGGSTIVIRDPNRGDVVTCRGCGFRKFPDIAYGKDGAMQEWVWNAAAIDQVLGTGTPTAVF